MTKENTKIASTLTILMAKLFGSKVVKQDGDIIVTSYIFRGKIFVTDVEKIDG